MRIQKIHYNTLINDNNLSEKAKDDSFIPITIPSKHYVTWHAVLDIRTCLYCAENHGKIFIKNDINVRFPPVHFCCKCTLEDVEAIEAGNATSNGIEGADFWLKYNGRLLEYYISRTQLEELGWRDGDKPSKFAPGKMFGDDTYHNRNGRLPKKTGRVWHEADINYTPGKRNSLRIVWSTDGLVFVTYDHYHTFYEII